MRFHPAVSIIIGYIVFLILYVISVSGFGLTSVIGIALAFVAFVLGGFIATYFAKEKKMQYGLYEGIGILIIFSLNAIIQGAPFGNYASLIIAFSIVLLLAVIGGFLGERVDKHLQNTEEK